MSTNKFTEEYEELTGLLGGGKKENKNQKTGKPRLTDQQHTHQSTGLPRWLLPRQPPRVAADSGSHTRRCCVTRLPPSTSKRAKMRFPACLSLQVNTVCVFISSGKHKLYPLVIQEFSTAREGSTSHPQVVQGSAVDPCCRGFWRCSF